MIRIPQSRLAQCMHCGIDVDTNGRGIHKRVEAWVPCVHKGHAGNTVTMAKELNRYICSECYERVKHNVSPLQRSIFDELQ